MSDKWKTFNGKHYRHKGYYNTKADAEHDKKYWQGRKYLARIVREASPQGNKVYSLYTKIK